ncbi:hypothetical protein PFICI_04707 [Pestalotiopsis fici W106-1]|uniref:Uncharacterized protein n=1 Tax=Pestalotiopsis fici (strain W106-1 / CGMCC3.15140) TaxID=1229662 RepID=W3XCD4_PESFW|nr:uncharacterized protein PFICI_04707 [Pestalotiopsis fici W106-1]ETS82831.1 hypothetical protein PFICI_04707 [Pestalotiopsis fici W106-1]
MYDNNSGFKPIDNLNFYPISGDWYRTADDPVDPYTGFNTEDGGFKVYLSMEPASPVGCAKQYQFCNAEFPGTEGCGPLTSLREAVVGVAPFYNTTYEELKRFYYIGNASSAQVARFDYFTSMFFGTLKSFDAMLSTLGSAGLLSQRTVYEGIQLSLPTNQWQLDMKHLWDISMASIQAEAIRHAYGPINGAVPSAWINFTGPALGKLCNNQKIRSTAYGSFSLFGLYFVLVVGIIIILTSYLLEPVSSLLHKRWGYKQYSHLEWTSNSILQLQQNAQEAVGPGTLTTGVKVAPARKSNERLNCLNPTDVSRSSLQLIKRTERPRSIRTSEEPEVDISDASASSLRETLNTIPMSVLESQAYHIEGRARTPYGTLDSSTTLASGSNTGSSSMPDSALGETSSFRSQQMPIQESEAPQILDRFDFEREVPPRGYFASYL